MKKLIVITLLVFISPTHANEAPNFFELANTYTIKIKTRIKYPFIKDSKGSHRGA